MNSACKEEENRKLSLACRLPIIIFAEDKLRPGKVRINSALRPARLSSQRRRYKKILHNIISKDFLPVLSTEKRYTDMDYVELNVRVTDPELAEILTAELAELPYESFQTEGEVLKAYIPRERLADCMQQTDDLLARYGIADRRYIAIESQNWNALWEQNFTPVDVDGRILIRAPFHAPQQGYELEGVVMPRMAFGSGHHATTCLVASALCDLPLEGKRGLDMGCGTGVLAIVAAKRGAATVDAVDIDEWAEANCRENAAANGLAERIVPMLGDAGRIAGRKYDFIAANINRNILTMDMPAYAEALDTGGDLLMSGFLEEDVPVIEARARACGLDPIEVRMRDGWAMVHVKKA